MRWTHQRVFAATLHTRQCSHQWTHINGKVVPSIVKWKDIVYLKRANHGTPSDPGGCATGRTPDSTLVNSQGAAVRSSGAYPGQGCLGNYASHMPRMEDICCSE